MWELKLKNSVQNSLVFRRQVVCMCVDIICRCFPRGIDQRESGGKMSDDGDIDVESAEDVPDIAVEATATTAEDRSEVYSPTVS